MKTKLPHITNLASTPVALQQFIDRIPIGVALVDKDRKVIMINRALEALTGISAEIAKGLPCYHVLRSRLCVKDCPVKNDNKDFEAERCDSDLIDRNRQIVPITINLSALRNLDNKLIGYLETVEDIRALRELDTKIGHAFSFASMVGRSPQMEKVYQVVPILAQSDSSVLITGETGTGKDLLAEALHQASNRSKGPFIKVNCGALPENLLESELFGHQKGAFTGAVENKPGRFRLAHNGTLFLTEIGDLPLTLQVKLLTFLDDQVIYPLGSTKGFQADVRVIAGTHRNLEKMVAQGTFRRDLLFRLNVVRIHLPPLREREGDLQLLLDHFLNTLNKKFQKKIKGFSKDALQILNYYLFPGNVRELRNIVEYAANICEGQEIEAEQLPAYLLSQNQSVIDGLLTDERQPIDELPVAPIQPDVSRQQTWSGTERQLIMNALIKAGGRKNEAAEILGWGRSTLWRKMKKYQID